MKKILFSLFVASSFCSMAQNVGINTTTPQAALDLNGDLILRTNNLPLVNNFNNNIDISSTKSAHYVVTGTSSVFYLTGFQGGIDGKTFSVYNPSGFIMIIKHLSPLSTAGNQIHTGTGLDFTMNSFSTVTFRYQANDNAWHIFSTGNDFNNPWVATSTGQIYNVTSGNVGIGTVGDAPQKFTVRQLGIGITQEGGLGGAQVGFYASAVGAYVQTHNNFDLLFSTNNGITQMIIQKVTGNVGIGTGNPTYKLSVNGNIRAKEVVVETAWADYVFDADYQLSSLSEVEKYIKANKHLPNIPAAEEIQKNGLRTAELQTKMMSKIEELTLYVIELEKKIEALNQIVNTKK
jgi:hypothetical protein